MFCDHGANIETVNSRGLTPLIYAATKGFDDICMYLSLRTEDVDLEDKTTGKNVFSIYLMKKDINRMKQLIMRGANINYCNKITGLTPLHTAIEAKLNSKCVKFLLKYGADPHIEDFQGLDCCDKALNIDRYAKIKTFINPECRADPSLRTKVEGQNLKNQLKKSF